MREYNTEEIPAESGVWYRCERKEKTNRDDDETGEEESICFILPHSDSSLVRQGLLVIGDGVGSVAERAKRFPG
jgi:hypothetical protein